MTRVLIVDDEPQILRALSINLRARGYDVVLAPDGRQALSAAAASPPDIVVLDLGLPDLDGVEVIGGVGGWASGPIFVVAGRAGRGSKGGGLRARAGGL